MRTTAVLLIGICGLLAKAFVGQSDSWGRLPSRSVAPAALWDQFLPKDPVDVPLNASALSNRLQDVIFTVMKKGLPQVDIDLPAGLILGVEGEEPDELEPRALQAKAGDSDKAKAAKKEREVRGDRELAGAFVQFFYEFKNSVNLCVLFRNPGLANLARTAWGDFGKARVVGFPSSKSVQDSADVAKLLRNRPWVLAVAPRARQLRQLQELSEMPDVKMQLILANARVRCRKQGEDLRRDVATASNPVLHVSFMSKDALVFKSIDTPWVMVRRDGTELWRGDEEPSREVLLDVLKR